MVTHTTWLRYRNAEGKLVKIWYVKQVVMWMFVVTVMKAVMILFMYLFGTLLQAVASFILYPFMQHPWTKLLMVMIATPLIMNAFQFWVVDNFIKKQELVSKPLEAGLESNVPCSGDYGLIGTEAPQRDVQPR